MSGYIGPKSADVPIGTISTKGTIAGNNLVIGSNNVSIGNAVTIAANGNVGINTSSPAVTLEANGASRFGGPLITSFPTQNVYNSTSTTTSNLYVYQTVNPIFEQTNSGSNTYYTILAQPGGYCSNNIGTSNYVNLIGIASTPRGHAPTNNNAIQLSGFTAGVYRLSSSDISNNSLSTLMGIYNRVGHLFSANSSIVTSAIYTSRNESTVQTGAVNSIYSNYNLTTVGTSSNYYANVTSVYSLWTQSLVGGLGNTSGFISNYYDAYLNGVSILGANSSVTNKYGVYQTKTDHINYFAGNTGIGTTTPSCPFQVQLLRGNTNTTVVAARFTSSGNGNTNRGTAVVIGSAGVSSAVDVAELVGYQEHSNTVANAASFAINVANTSGNLVERFRIDRNGNVGIGNTGSSYKLIVDGGYAAVRTADPRIDLVDSSNTDYTWNIQTTLQRFRIFNVSAGAGEFLTISNTGNVGIGNTTPIFKVDTNLGTISNNPTTFGYNIIGDCTNNPGYAGYNLSLFNTTANTTGFVRLSRTAATAYLGMEIQSQSRDGIRFLTDTTTPTERMRIASDGTIRSGTILRSPEYSQSFSVGTTQWIRLFTIESPSFAKICYMAGSVNSEENGEIILNLTYTGAQNRIEVTRQTYNSHLLEVRVTGSAGGPWTVFANIRSSNQAPNFRWNIVDLKSYNLTYTIHNDTTSPGAAVTSVTLENGGSVSRISQTNGTVAGINFLPTQLASSDANTLDDYEEGTWTPTLVPSTGTITSQITEGSYIKVGRLVTLTFSARITGGTVTVISQISGLPFVINTNTPVGASREWYVTGTMWETIGNNGQSTFGLIRYDNSSTCTNGYAWNGTFSYITNN